MVNVGGKQYGLCMSWGKNVGKIQEYAGAGGVDSEVHLDPLRTLLKTDTRNLSGHVPPLLKHQMVRGP